MNYTHFILLFTYNASDGFSLDKNRIGRSFMRMYHLAVTTSSNVISSSASEVVYLSDIKKESKPVAGELDSYTEIINEK